MLPDNIEEVPKVFKLVWDYHLGLLVVPAILFLALNLKVASAIVTRVAVSVMNVFPRESFLSIFLNH